MKNKYILIFLLFFSSIVFARESRVVAVVFYDEYCEEIPRARKSYLDAVQEKGYTLVNLCTPSRSARELKADIEAEAQKQGIKWSDIEGVNIIGPVVSTSRISLVSDGRLPHLPSIKNAGTSVVSLMFDDLSFSFMDDIRLDGMKSLRLNGLDYLTGVDSNYYVPSKLRWVSLLFAEGVAPGRLINKLSEAKARLASADEVNCGERYSNRVLAGLNDRSRGITDGWSEFPSGIGYNLLTYAASASAWYIMGASREAHGYSSTNRFQTTADKIGYGIVIIPAGVGFNLFATYNLFYHLFGSPLPNDDQNWKNYVLSQKLSVDGLSQQEFCSKGKK